MTITKHKLVLSTIVVIVNIVIFWFLLDFAKPSLYKSDGSANLWTIAWVITIFTAISHYSIYAMIDVYIMILERYSS